MNTRLLRVRDAMTSPAISVYPETTIGELIQCFVERKLRILPVIDAEHVLVGTVSTLDVLRLVTSEGPTAAALVSELVYHRVGSILDPEPATIDERADGDEALSRMAAAGVPSLPVVQCTSGRHVLVGMISQSDIMRPAGRPAARRRVPAAAGR